MEPEKRVRPAIRTAMQMSGGFGEVLAKRGQGKEQGLPFAALTVLIKGEKELFTIFEHPVALKDIIMLAGGLFLLISSTLEIHIKLEGEKNPHGLGAGWLV